MIDIHCHILPGVDDGAKDELESERMLKLAYAEGIRKIVTTPHYYAGIEDSDLEKREKALERLKVLAKKTASDLEIIPGAEIFYESEILEELKRGKVPTLNNTRYVLVEFPTDIDYSYIFHAVQNLQYVGTRPVIAHIERYDALKSERHVQSLVETGAWMQVNAASLTGHRSWSARRYLLKLMRRGLVHAIGTDAHGADHRPPKMRECAEYLEKKLGPEMKELLCRGNAARIVKGEYISE